MELKDYLADVKFTQEPDGQLRLEVNGETKDVTNINCQGSWSSPYYYYSATTDKTGVAFRIAAKLMEQKLVKVDTVDKFVKLVMSIRECV